MDLPNLLAWILPESMYLPDIFQRMEIYNYCGKLKSILLRINVFIKAEVYVICLNLWLRLRQITQTELGLNNSSYPTRTEFNNCFEYFEFWHKQHKPFVFCVWHKQHKLV